MGEGFSGEAFGDQTADTFSAALGARVAIRKQQRDDNLFLAWHIGAFSGAAQNGKLRPLDHYLKTETRDMSRGGAALLGAMRHLQKKGVAVKITKVGKR
jgi:hypothetical protein